MKKEVVVVGYSGHAWVAIDIFISMGWKVIGYCEKVEKKKNPYGIKYFGNEQNSKTLALLKKQFVFPAIGDNKQRAKVVEYLLSQKLTIANAVHSTAILSPNSFLGLGVMVGANVVVNSGSKIEDGVICNTLSVIEHECRIGKFAHIAPGTILCGNVKIGSRTLVGANSVVSPTIEIGDDVIVGSGSVIVKNIKNKKVVVGGNPLREL